MNQSEQRLVDYLEETAAPDGWSQRRFCCKSSRCLYCPECCQILLPEDDFPPVLREGKFSLPFDLDVILDVKERRTSATGIQVVTVANAVKTRRSELALEEPTTSVVLHDLARSKIPHYGEGGEMDGAYVLFPAADSVPISTVSPKKLIVLDIKWNKQTVTLDPEIARLPKVHLTSPPASSKYWRWHNAGQGMLSTIEAVYFAAMEVTDGVWTEPERGELLDLMWLFAIQRSVIHQKSEEEERLLPFSDEGKAERRALREKQKGNPPKKRDAKSNMYEKGQKQ